MLESQIRTYTYENGDIQKVQKVTLDSWDELEFFKPEYDPVAFDRICSLYSDFIVPRIPWLIGQLVFFHLEDDIEVPFSFESEKYGRVFNPLTACRIGFSENISYKNHHFIFKDKTTEDFFNLLKDKGYLRVVSGKLSSISFLPVSNSFGFLSESAKDARFKVNSSFFTMDRFDIASIYDTIGKEIGLCVKNGIILNPPLFDREVLTVDCSNNVSIEKITLNQLHYIIDGKEYVPETNCTVYSRPQLKKTPAGGFDIIITNDTVAAVKNNGESEIPSNGFVIKVNEAIAIKDIHVHFSGLEKYGFALQVGNSAIIDGQATEQFRSYFYDIRKFWTVSTPPSLYPLNYQKSRAPRIVLGNDSDNRPVVLWFEGAGKFGYKPKEDSCGASLKEVADICKDLKLLNGISLDGGGSAQMLVNNRRALLISDRKKEDFSEAERAVPIGLTVR